MKLGLIKTLFLSFFMLPTSYSITPNEVGGLFKDRWMWNASLQEELLNGNTISNSFVENGGEGEERWQEMKVNVAGLHPNSCEKSLKKMTKFEDYSKYLSLVKQSKYENEFAWFFIDHTIMPYPMSLEFKIPRITAPGDYVVMLTKGIFPDLRADLVVRDFEYKGKKCLYTLHAYWKGKKTNIPNIVLEVFTKTVTRLSLDGLFRATKK